MSDITSQENAKVSQIKDIEKRQKVLRDTMFDALIDTFETVLGNMEHVFPNDDSIKKFNEQRFEYFRNYKEKNNIKNEIDKEAIREYFDQFFTLDEKTGLRYLDTVIIFPILSNEGTNRLTAELATVKNQSEIKIHRDTHVEMQAIKGGLEDELQDIRKNISRTQATGLYVLQINLNRFGPLIFILTLIAIFARLYRYFVRLSYFYESCVDALVMYENNVDDVVYSSLIKSITSERFDFGKSELPPVEYAIELAKEIISKTEREKQSKD